MVGLFIDMFCFPLGTADVIDSFFHTISWNLEKKNRELNTLDAILNDHERVLRTVGM